MRIITLKKQVLLHIFLLRKNCLDPVPDLDPETFDGPDPKPESEPGRNLKFSKVGPGTPINRYGSTIYNTDRKPLFGKWISLVVCSGPVEEPAGGVGVRHHAGV